MLFDDRVIATLRRSRQNEGTHLKRNALAEHVITPLHAYSFDLSHAEHQARYDDLSRDGYRLVMVDGYRFGAQLLYGGIWIRDQKAVITRGRHGMTSSQYQSAFDTLREQGYALRSVSALGSRQFAGSATFAAVWTDGCWRDYRAHHNMTAGQYQQLSRDYLRDGYAVISISGYALGNQTRYAAIWSRRSTKRRRTHHGLTETDYQTVSDAMKEQGYHVAHLDAHTVGGQTTFAGIWLIQAGYVSHSRHNMDLATFREQCVTWINEDQRLVCFSGYGLTGAKRVAAVAVPEVRRWVATGSTHPELARFDDAVKELMQAGTISSGSLAIARNGALVLARGYGWCTEEEPPAQATSLFRLASISKTFTGTAIVRLIEEGRLTMADRLVDLIAMPGAIVDARMNAVSVAHLLHHVGGWDRTHSHRFDPMRADLTIAQAFNIPLPITKEAIVSFTNGRNLDFPPGQINGYKYTNYGYMLLGLIIEGVTGQPYEAYIQDTLFRPLGIQRLRLGRTLLRDRLPGEVLYHNGNMSSNGHTLRRNVVLRDAPVNASSTYGGTRSLENLAAAGGWVGTAVDLVRFASAFDDPEHCPILSKQSVSTLFAPHAYGDMPANNNTHYACGWRVRRGANPEQFHTGTLEGTRTLLWRRQTAAGDRINAALLFNKNSENVSNLTSSLRNMIMADGPWPNVRIWDQYF